MGPRVCFSMLLGSVVGFGILAPVSVKKGWAKLQGGTDGYAAFVTWVAMSIMIADSLTSLGVLLVRYAHQILARRRARRYVSLRSPRLPLAVNYERDTAFVTAPGVMHSISLHQRHVQVSFNLHWSGDCGERLRNSAWYNAAIGVQISVARVWNHHRRLKQARFVRSFQIGSGCLASLYLSLRPQVSSDTIFPCRTGKWLWRCFLRCLSQCLQSEL